MNGYFETHHIIPRSLGGDDSSSNLVDLTYREHFLAHWLLTKMFEGLNKRKMVYALYAMGMPSGARKRIVASWQFEVLKRAAKEQRLATREQRKEFARDHRLETIKEMVIDSKSKYVDREASAILALDRLTRKVKGNRGYRHRELRDALIKAGVDPSLLAPSNKKRLEAWKARRGR